MTPRRPSVRFALFILLAAAITAPSLSAQQAAPRQASRVTASFDRATLSEVLSFFSRYSGRSIVAGTGVAGTVSAEIADQPWDAALDAILTANGFYARELPSGILLVENPRTAVQAPGPVVTRVFRLNYATAAELEPAVKSMLSARGTVASVPSMNALIVTDEARVLDQVAAILGQE